jgi:TonB family protein
MRSIALCLSLLPTSFAAQDRVLGGETLLPDKPGVYRVGGGVSAPRLIDQAQPEYTNKARKAKKEGTVTIGVTVDVKGTTQDIQVEHSLAPDLDAAAVRAIKKWRFEPGKLNGQPVPVRLQIEIEFHLR